MGMIYKRGEIYWIKYYCGGRPIRSRRRRGSGGSGIEGYRPEPQWRSVSAADACLREGQEFFARGEGCIFLRND